MRRLYIPIIIVLMLGSFYGGYLLGSSDPEAPKELAEVKRERDILTSKLAVKYAESAKFEAMAIKEKKNALKADSMVEHLEHEKRTAAKKYTSRITKLNTATPEQLDTAMQERYPAPRQSFNTSLRPLVVSEWRMREIAQDLVRLDSIREASVYTDSVTQQLRSGIYYRDKQLFAKDRELDEKNEAIDLLIDRETTYAAESSVWHKTARKYKRQRNGVIAGVGAVAVTVGYFAVKSFLKR